MRMCIILKFKIIPGKIIIMVTRTFSLENLTNAIAEVQEGEGQSMRAVAQKYGTPKSTLHDHLRRNSKKVGAGGPTVLTPNIERDSSYMHHISRHGVWPYKRFGGGGKL